VKTDSQAINKRKEALDIQIKQTEDTESFFFPENAYPSNTGYVYDEPLPENYR
jgi:hypothetical protein